MFLSDRSLLRPRHCRTKRGEALRKLPEAGLLLEVKIDNLTRNPRACSQSKICHTFTLALFLDLSSERRLGDIGQASEDAVTSTIFQFD